jgi:hypothetical protein
MEDSCELIIAKFKGLPNGPETTKITPLDTQLDFYQKKNSTPLY